MKEDKLTQDDLNNLGEWIREGSYYPYLKLGDFLLYDRREKYNDSFLIKEFGRFRGRNVKEFQATTKEQLSKFCFFCEGKDLDFSAKKTYSWDSFILNMISSEADKFRAIFLNLHKTEFISVQQISSIIAGMKLRIIIDAINKDFPARDQYTHYPILDINDGIKYKPCLYKYNNIGCDSVEGFNKLVETNKPLLEQYFNKTETK